MDDLQKLFLNILPGKIKLMETALENIEFDYDKSIDEIRQNLHSFKNTKGWGNKHKIYKDGLTSKACALPLFLSDAITGWDLTQAN